MGGRKQLTTKEFIERAKRVHGDRYIYDKTMYTTSQAYVTVTCRVHGDFKQVARSHYAGRGNGADCYECSLITRARVKKKRAIAKKYENLTQPNDHKLIPLGKNKHAVIDNEDFEKVNKINWHYGKNGYASNIKVGTMHALIMDTIKTGKEVDHIDRDKLNNRRSNLRVATSSDNKQNIKRCKGSSIYNGVYWDNRHKNWGCRIQKNYKTYWLGSFDDEIEAAKAYDRKAKELYGEHAYLNFPENINIKKEGDN